MTEPRRSECIPLLIIVVLGLLVPLGLRPISAALTAGTPVSYLPALETHRQRRPFDFQAFDTIRRLKPRFVFIGDSMLGSRIDPTYLRRIIHQRVWSNARAGTGSAYWYLTLKNHVLGTGIRPSAVFVFFRDYNLTDLMWRLEPQYRWSLDMVAAPREPTLNGLIARWRRGAKSSVHAAVDEAYRAEAIRASVTERLRAWPARFLVGVAGAPFLEASMNELFELEDLRPVTAADIAAGEDHADFADDVSRSVLPEMLRLARARQVQLVFVRVQRRPEADRPPAQSRTLQRYVADLRAYLEANGAMLVDDTGEPAFTLDWYQDGDHVKGSRQRDYTEIFARRLAATFE